MNFLSIVSFIKDNIYTIGIIVVVVVILVGIISSLVKKPKKQEDKNDYYDKSLSLQKERSARKNTKVYANKWVIYKKDIQEYYVYLYDKSGNEILRSEMYASILGAQKDIKNIKEMIAEENYKISHDIDNNLYFLLKSPKKRLLATSKSYKTVKELEDSIKDLKIVSEEAEVDEGIVKDLSLTFYNKTQEEQSITSKNNWKIESIEGQMIGRLFDDNGNIILVTEEYPKKKEIKRIIDEFNYQIIHGNFVIDLDSKNTFYFKLRDNQKITLASGRTCSTLDECIEAIKKVEENI